MVQTMQAQGLQEGFINKVTFPCFEYCEQMVFLYVNTILNY